MAIATARYLNLFILLLPLPIHSLREQCCRDNGVPETCIRWCNASAVPHYSEANTLFRHDRQCQRHLAAVSMCLTNGRDMSTCVDRISSLKRHRSCYAFFNGTMHNLEQINDQYTECWYETAASFSSCLIASYSASPTPPQNLEIVSKTETTTDLKWDEPADNKDLVAGYFLYLIERNIVETIETTFNTTDRKFSLEGLSPNSSYVLYIRAYAAEYNGTSEWYKSQISNIVYFTTGIGLLLSSNEVGLPSVANSTIIYCKIKKIWGAELTVEWLKMDEDGPELLENGEKYSSVTINAEEGQDTLYSALKISSWNSSDFGSYRCYINKTRIEYVETEITPFDFSEESPGDNPPETITECCEKGLHLPECPSACKKIDVTFTTYSEKPKPDRRYGFIGRRATLVPLRDKGCKEATFKLMKCAHKAVNNAACCIHSKVPYHCLGVCDTQFYNGIFAMANCMPYMSAIFSCQIAVKELTPEAIDNVKTHYYWLGGYRMSWDACHGAQVYHVFTREGKRKWISRVTVDPVVELTSKVTEVVLLAVNEFGAAPQHRMILNDSDYFVTAEL